MEFLTMAVFGGIKALRLTLLGGLAMAAVAATPAWADDLRDALVAAYKTNPNLQGARAQQRAMRMW